MNRSAIRKEAHNRASMALDIADGRRQGGQEGEQRALHVRGVASPATRRTARHRPRAGDLVMGDPKFRLRVDSGIELYPHHFEDPDGAALSKVVSDFFGWEEPDTLSERVNSIEEEVTI